MGFVDKFDHLKSIYTVDRKSKKWWHRIFFHFLDVAVINSYILHKMLTYSEIDTAKQFRLTLLYELCAMGRSAETPLQKRPLSSSPQDAPRYKKRVSMETRFSNVDHMPVKGTRRRCAYCSTEKNSPISHDLCAKHAMLAYAFIKAVLRASKSTTQKTNKRRTCKYKCIKCK